MSVYCEWKGWKYLLSKTPWLYQRETVRIIIHGIPWFPVDIDNLSVEIFPWHVPMGWWNNGNSSGEFNFASGTTNCCILLFHFSCTVVTSYFLDILSVHDSKTRTWVHELRHWATDVMSHNQSQSRLFVLPDNWQQLDWHRTRVLVRFRVRFSVSLFMPAEVFEHWTVVDRTTDCDNDRKPPFILREHNAHIDRMSDKDKQQVNVVNLTTSCCWYEKRVSCIKLYN